jgi:hypothetical protein
MAVWSGKAIFGIALRQLTNVAADKQFSDAASPQW